MKRSRFLASLGAIATLPFLSFSKEEKPPVKPTVALAHDHKEQFIIRDSYRMSAEEVEHLRDGQLEYKEKWIEDQQMQRILQHIKQCPHLKKAKIINPDGSVEYHYLLSILPR